MCFDVMPQFVRYVSIYVRKILILNIVIVNMRIVEMFEFYG